MALILLYLSHGI